MQLCMHGFAASVCAQVGPEISFRAVYWAAQYSFGPVNNKTAKKKFLQINFRKSYLLRGTKNSIGSIVYVVMVTNLVTVTLVDIVWTYLIYSLFNGPKVNEYLIGDWICGIFDNVELFPFVHCTYLAHLNNNLKDSNHDVVHCVYRKVRLPHISG